MVINYEIISAIQAIITGGDDFKDEANQLESMLLDCAQDRVEVEAMLSALKERISQAQTEGSEAHLDILNQINSEFIKAFELPNIAQVLILYNVVAVVNITQSIEMGLKELANVVTRIKEMLVGPTSGPVLREQAGGADFVGEIEAAKKWLLEEEKREILGGELGEKLERLASAFERALTDEGLPYSYGDMLMGVVTKRDDKKK